MSEFVPMIPAPLRSRQLSPLKKDPSRSLHDAIRHVHECTAHTTFWPGAL